MYQQLFIITALVATTLSNPVPQFPAQNGPAQWGGPGPVPQQAAPWGPPPPSGPAQWGPGPAQQGPPPPAQGPPPPGITIGKPNNPNSPSVQAGPGGFAVNNPALGSFSKGPQGTTIAGKAGSITKGPQGTQISGSGGTITAGKGGISWTPPLPKEPKGKGKGFGW